LVPDFSALPCSTLSESLLIFPETIFISPLTLSIKVALCEGEVGEVSIGLALVDVWVLVVPVTPAFSLSLWEGEVEGRSVGLEVGDVRVLLVPVAPTFSLARSTTC